DAPRGSRSRSRRSRHKHKKRRDGGGRRRHAGAAEYSERQGHGMTPSVPSLAWPVWVAYALNS
ncbi:hypothetical protein AK812_SmicGene47968, partial [Symbiodinium microadriaticum]